MMKIVKICLFASIISCQNGFAEPSWLDSFEDGLSINGLVEAEKESMLWSDGIIKGPMTITRVVTRDTQSDLPDKIVKTTDFDVNEVLEKPDDYDVIDKADSHQPSNQQGRVEVGDVEKVVGGEKQQSQNPVANNDSQFESAVLALQKNGSELEDATIPPVKIADIQVNPENMDSNAKMVVTTAELNTANPDDSDVQESQTPQSEATPSASQKNTLEDRVQQLSTQIQDKETAAICFAKVSGFQKTFNLLTGTCENGIPNGTGKAAGEKGNYRGGFLNGQFHGKGRIYDYKSGDTYEGDFLNGLRHGEGYIVDKLTGVNRLAMFENDVFVRWLEKNAVNKYTKISVNPSYTRPIYSTIKSRNSKGLYLGKKTPYGKVVGIQGNVVSVETSFYDKDGYRRTAIRDYPTSMFR